MTEPFKIAIAGLGTVGAGVVRVLQTNGDLIKQRAGRPIKIVAVSGRDRNKNRGVDLSDYEWVDDPITLAVRTDIDAVVELIGGDEGPARKTVEDSLKSKKQVVTANKALIAKHGALLAEIAQNNKVGLCYEAAVAGAIPIIKALREGFAGNNITGIYGILNGTCNYILTEMRTSGRDFDNVLKEAQQKGYAEADPSFDIDGIDAAHKLCILSALGFGISPQLSAIDITGIRKIGSADIGFAHELGFRIKLLGVSRKQNGKIAQSVEPCLVPIDSSLGGVEGVFNAVYVEGDFIDRAMLQGRGAGAGPTASAVLSDLIDLARGKILPVFGVPATDLKEGAWAAPEEIVSEQYLHLKVYDQPGVIADVSAILRDYSISIETMLQRGRDPGQPVSVVITTHECSRAAIRGAIDQIARLSSMVSPPNILRIQRF